MTTDATDVERISSHMGDTILSCDKLGADGEVVRTEIVMFTTKIVKKEEA